MAIAKTRNEFKEQCLRKLGKPVINIEITDEQADDLIDECLSLWKDYHFDGSTKVFLKHQVSQEDIDRGWIETPNELTGIVGIMPIGSSLSSVGMFDIRYQFVLNEMVNLASFSLVDYYMTLSNVALMQELLVGRQPVRFNRHENKLWIDMNWQKIGVGQYVVIEGYAEIDADNYPDVWSDRWLLAYATQKFKYQWGSNIGSKFQDGILPGGLRFNGERIMTDAQEEIRRLEERIPYDIAGIPEDMIG